MSASGIDWTRELCIAADLGDLAQMKEAVSNGADINFALRIPAGGVSQNAFQHACQGALQYDDSKQWIEAARYLLDCGAYVDPLDSSGFTPLTLACRTGSEDLARMLLSYGADVQGRSRDGQSLWEPPLYYACSDGYVGLVKLLIENGANPFEGEADKRPIVQAFYWGRWEVARHLVDVASSGGQDDLDTALVLACRFTGNKSIHSLLIGLLIGRGANVNGFADRCNEMTPLVAAATWGDASAVSLLLGNGADPMVSGEPGVSVLDCVMRISGKQVNHAQSALVLAQAMGLSPLDKVNGKTLLASFSNQQAKEVIRDAQRLYRAKLMAESIDGAMGEVGDSPVPSKSSSGPSL